MKRFLLSFFLLLPFLSGVALGQVQEKKLADRLLSKPDATLNYDLRKSSFGSDRKFSTNESTVKNFTLDQRFTPKTFSSREFLGSREATVSQPRFTLSDASTKTFSDTEKKSPTKAVTVQDARDTGKTVSVRESKEVGQSFFPEGRSQDRFNLEQGTPGRGPVGYTGDLRPMTIEDIRTLLNKNK